MAGPVTLLGLSLGRKIFLDSFLAANKTAQEPKGLCPDVSLESFFPWMEGGSWMCCECVVLAKIQRINNDFQTP
jgi:hypothetical protein